MLVIALNPTPSGEEKDGVRPRGEWMDDLQMQGCGSSSKRGGLLARWEVVFGG